MAYTLKFAENLKNEIENSPLSQEKIAKALGTTQATVSRWCSGRYQPDFETLFRLCKILDTTPNVLLGWED